VGVATHHIMLQIPAKLNTNYRYKVYCISQNGLYESYQK